MTELLAYLARRQSPQTPQHLEAIAIVSAGLGVIFEVTALQVAGACVGFLYVAALALREWWRR